ncbi:class I SAM-dependent methyltransferase [Streptococcus pseudoporcinus]|uniref:Tetracenomycin polyketide synthesis O-methyltransferase tcmP n=1 Tax=Streptococcus pseudoporcinus TaxID=361101 RepID=A0A4U9XVJ0_9STRE|nr:class I SAM-dependent methyltransferase [Streptococcus pseudoporcinus]VTS16875.1 Tetracenomycin polyketide synthesis O-methyltransferase tcmP [Streptococcus pseudoporcinus]VUC68107.1 Tetracenomycin polyketide synthesis O-methyltransferase tcmP [Streptococcus pseudoporcinus]VUC98995.1 Tetracenomycin polyketide synthesis O-methyltransferase tcmP [Streptococcus pseudoporcinus]VUC99387.1 Tetracenomycin polyketide synthesis O-methyltransferase tcmP [Streptococcus pseudoporcinus]
MEMKLSGISQSLLLPLYARAEETQRTDALFKDFTAIKILKDLEIAPSKYKKSNFSTLGCIARTKILDDKVKEYIAKNPEARIVNLGCGLDDRYRRVDNGRIHWYNIDFPEVISLRDKYIQNDERVINLAQSVLDYIWLDKISYDHSDNILIIAEGLLMYLEEKEVKELFINIASKFNNLTLYLELMSSWMVHNQKFHDITDSDKIIFKWGVDKVKDFEDICPNYQLSESINLTYFMKKRSIFLKLFSKKMEKINNHIAVFHKKI